MGDETKTAGKPAVSTTEAEKPAGYTNEQLAKMAKGITVRVFDRNKKGEILVDEKTKQKLVIERAITAEDVHAHHVRGDQVTIVTVDGQKIIVPAA